MVSDIQIGSQSRRSLLGANIPSLRTLRLLHTAARSNVGTLLERGTIPGAFPDDHSTPPRKLADKGNLAAAVRPLLNHGANSQAHRKDPWTPLHDASCSGNPDDVRFLQERSAELEAQFDDHSTPLQIAVENGEGAAVQSLIDHGKDHGANIHVSNENRLTPLQSAARYGHTEVVRLLLERTGDLEARPDSHCTGENSSD